MTDSLLASDSSTDAERDQTTPADEAAGVVYSTTPSGIEIEFTHEGHKYRIRGSDSTLRYHDWQEVPSASKVADSVGKDLSWWAMKVGVEGVLELFNRDKMTWSIDGPVIPGENATLELATAEEIVELLTAEKLTTNHVVSKAGTRGTAVHKAFERWAETGVIAEPGDYLEEYRGYITGLNRFITDSGIECIHSEVPVASLKYGFAGRFDLIGQAPGNTKVCEHVTEVARREDYKTLPAGRFLIDLKTSKDVYKETHFRQVEGYEIAAVESGYEPSDFRAILNVQSDGRYQLKASKATAQDFLDSLAVFKGNLGIRERSKRRK